MQRLQADWAAKHAVIAGGLASGACIVFGGGGGGGGRPIVHRLQADWSVGSTAALAGGLVNPAYRRLQAGWSVDRPALQAE